MKRRLTSIRLDKIAGVDAPCQEHATVAIVKRAPAAPTAGTPLAIAKKSFDEALRGQLMSERVSEVFWRAFDKQWAVREAFRESLTDELAEGGDGSEATDGFIDAMRVIAETAAEAAREAGADASDQDLESAVEQAVEKWLKQQETVVMKIETKAALTKAVAEFNASTSPAAHIAIIKAAAKTLDAEDELPAEGLLAKEAAPATDDVAVLKRRLDVAEMPAAIRKHFDALDEAGQTEFLAKDAAGRQAEVDQAASVDPVVHKCLDGTEIRKSDGPGALAMAKRADALSKEVGELREAQSGDAFEKRARDEFPHVAKAIVVDMLKSAKQVGEDTETGKSILKSLDTMNKASSGLFKRLGSTEAPEVSGDIAKARANYDAAVSKIAARDKIGIGDAMSKARIEEPELFAEAYPETIAAEEEAAG